MTKKHIFSLTACLFLVLALLSYGISLLSIPSLGEVHKMDSYVTVDVTKKDGSTYHADSNYFGPVQKGDRLTMHIPLPKDKEIDPGVIFLSVYQCAVTLSYNGEVLYAYGQKEAEKGIAMGNILVYADIPKEAWGDFLTLDCYVADYCDFSKFSDIRICEAKRGIRNILGEKIPSYLFSVTILIFFSMLFVALPFWRSGGIIRKQGMCLSAFCVSFMLWQMGFDRMFYVWGDNPAICGIVEYVGLFLTPAPFCMFMYFVEKNKYFRKAMAILSSLFTILFVAATILNFTTKEWHYSRLLKLNHILIGAAALALLLECIFVRTKGDGKSRMIRFGIILYLIFIGADFLTFYVDTVGASTVDKGLLSISSLGMYLFVILMLISYMMHILEHVISIRDKAKLEKMAYQDALTNAPNRQSCLDYINALKHKKEYTVFFFDVNNLKYANDEFGHEAGDRLILALSEILTSVFGDGFYGRYGGDEFIAVVEYTEEEKIKAIEENLAKCAEEINARGDIPTKVQFSYGTAASFEGEDADDVVRMADKRMYEQKWKMKNKGQTAM